MAVEFYTEPIAVEFDTPPAFARRPPCPDRLVWRGETFHVADLLAEWRRATPRITKRMRRLGLARIYFRIRTTTGRIFDIYFDPVHNRGAWFMSRETRDYRPQTSVNRR